MKESKYFYNCISLFKYCKDNNINIITIRARIWKKKQSKKYENYIEQEIVDMVIEAYSSAIKYMYKGIALRQYCDENNLSYRNLIIYMSRYRNTDNFKGLSDDEFVEAIMD